MLFLYKMQVHPFDEQGSQWKGPELHDLDVALIHTADDMSAQLRCLAVHNQAADLRALQQELGDWVFYGRGDIAPVLHVPYFGSC